MNVSFVTFNFCCFRCNIWKACWHTGLNMRVKFRVFRHGWTLRRTDSRENTGLRIYPPYRTPSKTVRFVYLTRHIVLFYSTWPLWGGFPHHWNTIFLLFYLTCNRKWRRWWRRRRESWREWRNKPVLLSKTRQTKLVLLSWSLYKPWITHGPIWTTWYYYLFHLYFILIRP